MDDRNSSRGRYVAQPDSRILSLETVVAAPAAEVWAAWTSTEGVRTFFASEARVELRPGGPYELYFDTAAPAGSRGSEGCRVLSYLPERMLSFEWNAPPQYGDLRGIHTFVVVFFEEVEFGRTKVVLSHLGWGEGADWDAVYAYFESAWAYVLGNLKARFDSGPLDWEASDFAD